MKTGAIVAAAGLSPQEGSFKPLLKVGSITVVKRIILTLQQAGADTVVIVTGHNAEPLEKHVVRMKVICLRNERCAESQMLDSAKIGLAYLMDKCDRVLFAPVGVPLFTVGTVRSLTACESPAAAPVCNGKEGYPLLISSALIPDILKYDGEGGLAGAIRSCGQPKRLVDVDDEGVLFDAATQEECNELLESHNKQLFRPHIQVRLAREEPFFGPGTAMLLTLIKQTESVKTACKMMRLSYSKGWNMLKLLEKNVGYQVVDRRQGGAHGSSTSLTARGGVLLERYERLEKETAVYTQSLFERIFEE